MAAPTKMEVKSNFQSYKEVSNEAPALIATVQEGLMHKISSENLDKISGSGGFEAIVAITVFGSKNYKCLVINTDTVFTALEEDGINVMAAKNLTGFTFSAGQYLPASLGSTFTKVTLASGTAIGYN